MGCGDFAESDNEMQQEQAVDFVTYYDAANTHWLVLIAMAVSTALVALAVGTAIWRRLKR